MTTLLVSDLHLAGERIGILELFARFLREEAVHAHALYILGDLFEYWIGDDHRPAELAAVERQIATVAEQGVPVYFMHGNRDFLIGRDFAARTGAQLLADPSVIDLYGHKTLLMHGDTLCTDDHDYQSFRCQVRNPTWQRDFLDLPIEQRLVIARQYRDSSRAHNKEKPPEIMDVNSDAVKETLREHKVDRLIHGHTHRPAVHQLKLGANSAERIVLGDWYERGSVLRCDETGCRLEVYPAA